jgi:hypothetical protein
MANITFRPCPRGTECASYSMTCKNEQCMCSVFDGMVGPKCEKLTLKSLPMLIARVCEFVVFLPMAIYFGIQLRKTWIASRAAKRAWVFKFLLSPLVLVLCGTSLLVADAVVTLLDALTDIVRLGFIEGYIWSNLLNGMGMAVINIGLAVIPLLWCEIALASSRFRRMHRSLLLTRRFLTGYLILNVITVIGLAVICPIYPRHAHQWLALFSFFSVIVVLIEYSSGAWLLSRALRMTQGVRPATTMCSSVNGSGGPKARSDSVGNVEAATEQAKTTARAFAFCSISALLGVVLWQIGRVTESPALLYCGVELGKLVGIAGTCSCELRYIIWVREATTATSRDAASRATQDDDGTLKRSRSDDLSSDFEVPSPRSSNAVSKTFAKLMGRTTRCSCSFHELSSASLAQALGRRSSLRSSLGEASSVSTGGGGAAAHTESSPCDVPSSSPEPSWGSTLKPVVI